MAMINELNVLTKKMSVYYGDALLVYFIFEGDKEPVILACRYVAEKRAIIQWLKRAEMDSSIRIVIVWPGEWRSEAYLCDPAVALRKFHEYGDC